MIQKNKAEEARHNRNQQLLNEAKMLAESTIDAAISKEGCTTTLVQLEGVDDERWPSVEQHIRERYTGENGGWKVEFGESIGHKPNGPRLVILS